MSVDHPELVSEYLEYVGHKIGFAKTGKIDLSGVEFIYSTTLLPLSNLINNNKSCYIKPNSYPPANYIKTMMKPPRPNAEKSYLPIVRLPPVQEDDSATMKRVYSLQKGGDFGGKSAFTYFVDELVDNIYQHSQFTIGLIMGQPYRAKRFTDLSIYDNGITIPKTLEGKKSGGPSSLIREALNGVSSKGSGRGFGLRTALNLFTRGIGAKFFIASGAGAVYIDRDHDTQFSLAPDVALDGTLITVRAPMDTHPVDIYRYVE